MSREGDRYVVESRSWNADLDPGSGVQFGFLGAPQGGAISVSDLRVTGAAPLEITLDRAAVDPVTVTCAIQTGSAGAVDFAACSGSMVFAPGETSKTVAIGVTDDLLDEADARFEVRLTVADGRATVTIVVDDLPPVPKISVASESVTEGDPMPGGSPGWFSTDGARIVDSAGEEVRLTGVNWFGAETVRGAPDGLFIRNWQDMMDQMVELGFNTIRLPFSNDALRPGAWPTDINSAINADPSGLSSLEVSDEVVKYAGEIGLRIILDNHRNAAGDGASSNGLWYGEGTSQGRWIADWETLAARSGGRPGHGGLRPLQ